MQAQRKSTYLIKLGKRTRGEKGDTLRSKTDPFLHTYYGGDAENDNDIINRVVELAAKKSVSPSQLSIAWLLNKQQVEMN